MAEKDASENQPTGVIDTIGYAFAILNRRPYLIWLPALVDLILWTGLRIPARGLDFGEPGTNRVQQLLLDEGLSEIEIVSVATWSIPNLLGQAQFADVPAPVSLAAIESGAQSGLFLMGAAIVFSVLLLAMWTILTGRLVQQRPASDVNVLRETLKTGAQVIVATAYVAALILFMSLPMLLIAGGLLLMDVDPLVLLMLSLLLLSGWLGLFFSFTLPAFALAERRVGTALRSSYQFVQENFLAVLGLLLIILIIRAATPHALSVFAESQWSVPFAIIVNAYVVTGMLAAVLLLYSNRSPDTRASTMTSPVPTSG
jgi:uncharacterized integral membrane protein